MTRRRVLSLPEKLRVFRLVSQGSSRSEIQARFDMSERAALRLVSLCRKLRPETAPAALEAFRPGQKPKPYWKSGRK